MKDKKFLTWIHDRLEQIHGENHNFDYMHKLRSVIDATGDTETPCKLDVDVSGWISVDTELPDDEDRVMVFLSGDASGHHVGWFDGEMWAIGDVFVSWDYLMAFGCDLKVTHWMPLPSSPNE